MAKNRILEQHIAVFGESGSGKTVMLSSFYGAAQEPENIKRSGLNVIAENANQGILLSQAFLGMKKTATLPEPTRFSSKTYSFRVTLKHPRGAKTRRSNLDALKLVWHDYPGEWFEQDVSGPIEEKRRIDTFRSLLSSDVALILIDSQKLLDNAGHEERYLKSLVTNFRQSLLRLKDELLAGGNRLVNFPRIWMLALSKSDLVPEMQVQSFKDLVLEKVGNDIAELRDVIADFIESEEALSVGEDFVLLSSAKFGENTIDVAKRVGLDLVLPIAAVLPFERHVRWANAAKLPAKVAADLLGSAASVAAAIGIAGKWASVAIGKKNKIIGTLGLMLSTYGPDAIKLAAEKLKELDTNTAQRHQTLSTTLLRFHQDLERAESQNVLQRSIR